MYVLGLCLMIVDWAVCSFFMILGQSYSHFLKFHLFSTSNPTVYLVWEGASYSMQLSHHTIFTNSHLVLKCVFGGFFCH